MTERKSPTLHANTTSAAAAAPPAPPSPAAGLSAPARQRQGTTPAASRQPPTLGHAAPPAPAAPDPQPQVAPIQAPRRTPVTSPQAAPPPKTKAAASGSWFGVLIWVLLTLLAFLIGLIVLLRWVPPPLTAFMVNSPVQPVKYLWVPQSRIAPAMAQAVIAAEDQKFYRHHGFDTEAIKQAIDDNRHRERPRGASTISQQTAKNLFLWSGGGYLRKGLEAGLTLAIETLWPKQRILEMYLNIAEFGAGVYGVEAAARSFFGVTAAELNEQQAAQLAAVLPSPRRFSANAPSGYVQSRAAWILRQMHPQTAVAGDDPEPLPDDEPAPADEQTPTAPPASVQTEALGGADGGANAPRAIDDDQPLDLGQTHPRR
ncbi:monofunctional biosynthetic peptidoglycan transglycosylase [Sinimarinibacterium sp. NLF-5-8]|nr:monofunctional biosynthetic peptidoglycan transglycosylase [Sinimarinibacterium sp. NLF-5-8]QHS08811.1 monofunctional biosynthetic peptidoglycan transglycosylase [Sinimarinibacterium sp. NLF-5-8]